jgi:sterol desaturase/sphingolipid hydroxylase (fatty acid hydroxylase superfamily)
MKSKILRAAIGFPLGLLYVNAGEWLIHKHWLHGRGKKKDSFWNFHWGEHHGNSRKDGFYDKTYERSVFEWNAQGKEAAGLAFAALTHAPLAKVFPFFYAGILYGIGNYYRVHKKSHNNPEWAREHLPWHYDHHMGPNQDANWCVSRPWFDTVMGTREVYVGTEKERADGEVQARRRAAAMAEKLANQAQARQAAKGDAAAAGDDGTQAAHAG